MNRLHLNFNLPSAKQRAQFVKTYTKTFNPTKNECETIANYLLFGKDDDGKNGVQRKEYFIATRNAAWQTEANDISIESLKERQKFNEAFVTWRKSNPVTKVIKPKMARSEAIKKATDPTALRELWKKIDELALLCDTWAWENNKRKTEPEDLAPECPNWTQHEWLKKRHELVELRKQQYAHMPDAMIVAPTLSFCAGAEHPVIGPVNPSAHWSLDRTQLSPDHHLATTARMRDYWENKQNMTLDLRDEAVIKMLMLGWEDIEDEAAAEEERHDVESWWRDLRDLLGQYIASAGLTEAQQIVLHGKQHGLTNKQIRAEVMSKTDKTHTENYISTIFTKICCKAIAAQARQHMEEVENSADPSAWFKCNECGRIMLANSENFAMKGDHFATVCRRCEKARKEKRKHGNL